MSKSRGNVVGPDHYIAAHGSDVLRCALLFTCPWELGGDFHDDTIYGIERFFCRVWNIVTAPAVPEEGPDPLIERAIVGVTEAIEKFSFNVGLARLMELAPAATTSRAKRYPGPTPCTLCPPSGRGALGQTRWCLQRPHQQMADT
jgi:leucyl-tRNA synthetase